LFGTFSVIIYTVLGVWSTAFETACFRSLFFLDCSLLENSAGKPASKPVPKPSNNEGYPEGFALERKRKPAKKRAKKKKA